MGEYIDREAAKHVLRERYRIRTHFHDMESAAQLKCAELEIGDIPAADVRPVVLCRDCDCWNVWDRVEDTCSCAFWSEDRLIYTKEEDFCSWGRKRGVAE